MSDWSRTAAPSHRCRSRSSFTLVVVVSYDKSMTSLLIVSGIRFYREGLAQLLSAIDGIFVQAVASRWPEAVAKTGKMHPTVVLLDVSVVPERRCLFNLFQVSPLTRVVMLALSELESDTVQWIESGIHGYVPCDASVDDIAQAVKTAAAGQVPCPPDLAAMLFRRVSQSGRQTMLRTHGPARMLTAREMQILHLLANGVSNKRIALQLDIAIGTVKNHVHNILQKLRLERRAQVASWYHKHVRRLTWRDGQVMARRTPSQ